MLTLAIGAMMVVMFIFHFYHPSEVGSLLRGGKVAKLFRVQTVEKSEGPLDDVELNNSAVYDVGGK